MLDRFVTVSTGTAPNAAVDCADDSWAMQDAALTALVRVGQRLAPRDLVTPALLQYWRLLTLTDPARRAALLAQLRTRIRAGETTHRAWLAVALGECDATLVREAVVGYVGAPPVSVERRDAALADVFDWLRRGLPLNRVAVFVALLLFEDEAILENLRGLRGSLTDVEAVSVLARTACVTSDPARGFCDDWRASLGPDCAGAEALRDLVVAAANADGVSRGAGSGDLCGSHAAQP